MGTDIHGFVECRMWLPGLAYDERRWHPVLDVRHAGLTRDYPVFDMLFGVRASGAWDPVAAERGLPEDVSGNVRAEHDYWDDQIHGTSWISWREIDTLDWAERAPRGDRPARADVLGGGSRWTGVADILRILADHHGDDAVRLVVWFDS